MADTVSRSRELAGLVFLAVRLEASVGEEVRRTASWFKRRCGLTGKLLAADRLHFTLLPVCFPGEASEGVIAAVKWAMSAVEHPAFVVDLQWAMSLRGQPGNSPFVFGGGDDAVSGLFNLREAILKALVRNGLRPTQPRAFLPHVTTLYDGRQIPETPIDPIRCRVAAFSLVHSQHGSGRYGTLGSWRLAAPALP